MATKKNALPSKKPPPPPKTRPGPGQAPSYGPQGKVPARAPGERYATLPPGMLSTGRPLPNTYTRVAAPAPAPVPAPRPAVRPPAPVAPPVPVAPAVPARPQPVGPKSLPPSIEPVQYRPGMEVQAPEMPMPEPIYDPGPEPMPMQDPFKRGGAVKKFAKGGAVGASRRADGIAQRGKTKGRYI